jgi:putative sugar O-methyltransferase
MSGRKILMTVETSKLWNSLCADLFAKVDDEFLDKFRRPGGANKRLAAWDPFDQTMRYFKFMLFTAAERQSERFFQLYRALENVDLGHPIAVTVRSCAINIDYFLSIEEFLFLESAVDLGKIRSIVEIGAGFGRTCHALLALTAGQIEQYTIVDLPQVLELSRHALLRLIPQHYRKIRFVNASNEEAWQGLAADMAINIDSFQEMPSTTIDLYMKNMVSNCGIFYVKNPIAKYDPKTIGLTNVGEHALQDVFSLGYCRDVIDIFDDVALGRARQTYVEAYRPASGWELVADRPMEMFPYYHHAVYRRD